VRCKIEIFALVMIFSLIISPSLTYAQGEGNSFFIGGELGLALPTTPSSFSDSRGSAVSFGGFAGYSFTPEFSLEGSISYISMPTDMSGVNQTIIPIAVVGRYNLSYSENLATYLEGGAGIYISTVNLDSSSVEGTSSSDLGVLFGGGVSYRIAEQTSLEGKIRYNQILSIGSEGADWDNYGIANFSIGLRYYAQFVVEEQ